MEDRPVLRTEKQPLSTPQAIDAIRREGYRPNVIICITNQGEVLLGVKNESWGSVFEFPQGGIEPGVQGAPGETVDEAALREVAEEVKATLSPDTPVSFVTESRLDFAEGKGRGSRSVTTDEGENIEMLGKHYFSVTLEAPSRADFIPRTRKDDEGYDELLWLTYSAATAKNQEINTAEDKRALIQGILDKLHARDLVK